MAHILPTTLRRRLAQPAEAAGTECSHSRDDVDKTREPLCGGTSPEATRRAGADIPISLAPCWFDGPMSASAQGSEARSSSHYLFRMSREDKQRLKRRAAAAGMTIQAYLEHTALGYDHPQSRPPGRPRKQEIQEELNLSA